MASRWLCPLLRVVRALRVASIATAAPSSSLPGHPYRAGNRGEARQCASRSPCRAVTCLCLDALELASWQDESMRQLPEGSLWQAHVTKPPPTGYKQQQQKQQEQQRGQTWESMWAQVIKVLNLSHNKNKIALTWEHPRGWPTFPSGVPAWMIVCLRRCVILPA